MAKPAPKSDNKQVAGLKQKPQGKPQPKPAKELLRKHAKGGVHKQQQQKPVKKAAPEPQQQADSQDGKQPASNK